MDYLTDHPQYVCLQNCGLLLFIRVEEIVSEYKSYIYLDYTCVNACTIMLQMFCVSVVKFFESVLYFLKLLIFFKLK